MKRLVYFGPFYTDAVVRARRLPTRNLAGYNRMQRFALAMQAAGARPLIVSTGITMRVKYAGRILHPEHRARTKGLGIVSIAAVGLPVLGIACEPFLLMRWILKYRRSLRKRAILIYNFSPAYVVLAVLLRLLGIHYHSQIEDISIPELRDWLPASETSAVRQIVFFLCTRIIVALSQGVVVPSRRFLRALPKKNSVLVQTGCVQPGENTIRCPDLRTQPIQVLFVGKYQQEHGLRLLCDTIELLAERETRADFCFHCCGARTYPKRLRDLLKNPHGPCVILHGFLADKEYHELLRNADIALALQLSDGRHCEYKTPSKAYEFQGYGKLVIACDVGDLRDLADHAIVLLEQETAEALAQILCDCIRNPARYENRAVAGLKNAQEDYGFVTVGRRLLAFMGALALEKDRFG